VNWLVWVTQTMFPYPLCTPAKETVPHAAAWIAVPVGAAMSMPSCIRPQRMPNSDVTGPFTGALTVADEQLPPLGARVTGGPVVGALVEGFCVLGVSEVGAGAGLSVEVSLTGRVVAGAWAAGAAAPLTAAAVTSAGVAERVSLACVEPPLNSPLDELEVDTPGAFRIRDDQVPSPTMPSTWSPARVW
jgi:hypothetical protein